MDLTRLKLVSFLIPGVVFFSCHTGTKDKQTTQKTKATPRVEGYIVQPSELNTDITVSGTIKPFEETALMPDVSGRVVTMNLPEGKFVKQGTLLVKLFDGDLQAQLKKAKLQLQIAEQTQKRQAELLKVSGISQSDYDQTELQVNSIRADIDLLQVQIRKTEILAPFDGTIGLRNISVGAQVSPSVTVVTIRANDRLKLDFSIPEKYSAGVQQGGSVTFTIQGNDHQWQAKVLATEEGISSETRNLNVRAIVEGKIPGLVPGSFANVNLRIHHNPKAIMVPSQVIIPQDKNKQVIIASNGKAKFVKVKTGERTANTIEILEGLTAGDTVITNGLLFLKPNAPVKFSKVKTGTL
jgi:membrane fusion protein (multidrug efflux system)